MDHTCIKLYINSFFSARYEINVLGRKNTLAKSFFASKKLGYLRIKPEAVGI